MKKILILLSLIFCAMHFVNGQGINNTWYFGYHAGLDFNSGIPVALTNGQTNQWEGVSTISDSSGNLLFYTDGIKVWDRLHTMMPNGYGLSGNASSTQSGTIVPMPGSTSQYYIFTCAEISNPGNFNYSIVDMNLNAGFGDITLKNIPLHSQSSEKCAVVYKDGAADIWVIGHNIDTIFYSYLVTASGINPAVLSFNQINPGGFEIGYMKASPQGNMIAAALYSTTSDNFVLYDFNCSSGIINNEKIISVGNPSGVYAVEFSPDGTKLYVIPWNPNGITPTAIFQYDITLGTTAAIAASKVTIGILGHGNVGDAQLGPDQKIYISADFQDSLAVINYPNLPGISCGLVDNMVSLGGGYSGIGLPALIRGSGCNTTAVESVSPDPSIAIFPNPATNELYLNNASLKIKSVEIFDIIGQRVFQQKLNLSGTTAIKLDIKGLDAGIYFVEINSGQEKTIKKILKE